jgi:hypothetical protein
MRYLIPATVSLITTVHDVRMINSCNDICIIQYLFINALSVDMEQKVGVQDIATDKTWTLACNGDAESPDLNK